MMDVPVDTGWAWIVALGVSWLYLWGYGLMRIVGMIFIEINNFHSSSASQSSLLFTASTIGSFIGFCVHTCLIGSISHRVVCVMGTLSQCISLVTLYLLNNIYLVTSLSGFLIGFGVAWITSGSLMVMMTYFKVKLSLVTGLCFFGSGFGAIGFPYLFEWLLAEYGTRSTMLILCGFVSHSLIGCMLFRPASYYKNIRSRVDKKKNELETSSDKYKKTSATLELGIELTRGQHGASNPAYVGDDVIRNYSNQTGTDQWNANKGTSLPRNEQNAVRSLPTRTGKDELCLSAAKLSQADDRRPVPSTEAQDSPTKSTDASLLADIRRMFQIRSFPLYLASKVLGLNAFLLFASFLAPYVSSEGVTSSSLALVLAVNGVSDMIAKPLHGWVVSGLLIDANMYIGVLGVLASVISAVLVSKPSEATFYVLAVTVGGLVYPLTSLFNTTTLESVGSALCARAIVFVNALATIVYTPWPLYFGWLYDTHGSYSIQLYIIAGLSFLGGVFSVFEAVVRRYTKHHN